jgi:hypothetical protein
MVSRPAAGDKNTRFDDDPEKKPRETPIFDLGPNAKPLVTSFALGGRPGAALLSVGPTFSLSRETPGFPVLPSVVLVPGE